MSSVAPEVTETGTYVGQSVPRKEDGRLVQGQGVFVDDIKRHNMGYIHFVRSPYAHARIGSVDVSAALALPGVYGTLTGDEVAILTDPFFQIAADPGGQVDRVNAARIAVQKAGDRAAGAVAASDAFFPFPDGPELLLDAGVTALIHPGGSVKDADSIAVADAHNAAMLLTGVRHFRH